MGGVGSEEHAWQEAGPSAVAALPAPPDTAQAAPAVGAWSHHAPQPVGACWRCKT